MLARWLRRRRSRVGRTFIERNAVLLRDGRYRLVMREPWTVEGDRGCEHRQRRDRDAAGRARVRLAFRVRGRKDRDTRDERVVEQRALPVLVKLLLVPSLPCLGLSFEQARKPDSLLAGADRAELEAVVAEADRDAVRQKTWA